MYIDEVEQTHEDLQFLQLALAEMRQVCPFPQVCVPLLYRGQVLPNLNI